MDGSTIVTKVLEGHASEMKKLEGISKRRYAFASAAQIAKEQEYFLGITGLRGIGKTILLLQLAQETGGVYFAADDRNLRGVAIYDAIKALSDAGHKSIFIDEIHAKPDWDSDLKTAYDESLAYVAFTGSSAIEIKTLKSDLSRRAVVEHLKPASFREWLSIKKNSELPLLEIKGIFKEKANLARKFASAHKSLGEYYAAGGVLYDAKFQFYKTVVSTVETIAYKDFAAIKGVEEDTVENFFKLLRLVAASKPMELSYSSIGEVLGKNKVWVMRFLENVERTEAIKRVFACGEGAKPIRKEAKYYLPFPYRAALCESAGKKPEIGSLREEFFINHVECCYLRASGKPAADFKADGRTFEVGGLGKDGRQGADYLVVDGLDTSANRVPLFLFGLVY